MRALKLFIAVAVYILFVPADVIIAQPGTTANVGGIVEDSMKARILDARVELVNALSGTASEATTNRDGAFSWAGIAPGSYVLRIEREGFATAQVSGLVLNGGDMKNLLVRLRVGPVTETIEVDASTVSIDIRIPSASFSALCCGMERCNGTGTWQVAGLNHLLFGFRGKPAPAGTEKGHQPAKPHTRRDRLFSGGNHLELPIAATDVPAILFPRVQAFSSYTWAHGIDFGSTAPNFPLERGNSDVDVRHNYQAAITWSGQSQEGGFWRRSILDGWGIDGRLMARSGFPINLQGNLFCDPATGERYLSGVDRIAGRPLYLTGSEYPGGRMINGGPTAPAPAFSVPIGTEAGNAPRNQVRGFGTFQINADVRRDVKLYRSSSFQLRIEAYNLFNHPDLGYIDPWISNALFGRATLLLNQSFGDAGTQYQPGGPRSIQFSGRFRF